MRKPSSSSKSMSPKDDKKRDIRELARQGIEKTRQTLKKIEEKQEKLKKETQKTPVVSSEEEDTDLELHCQMTENLIEPNMVVCVNSFYVILIKFTFVLAGEKET